MNVKLYGFHTGAAACVLHVQSRARLAARMNRALVWANFTTDGARVTHFRASAAAGGVPLQRLADSFSVIRSITLYCARIQVSSRMSTEESSVRPPAVSRTM